MSSYCWVTLFLLAVSPLLVKASFDIYVKHDFRPPRASIFNDTSEEASRRLSPLDKQPIEPNPMFRSPYEGTDITSKPTKIVSCEKQTQCIAPALQLTRTYKVYYCKRVSHGVRFYYLIREGLTLHPNIQLVQSPEEAELIIYLPESANWAKSECRKPEYFSKMVVLDESDGSHILAKPNPQGGPWYILYFKRSFVDRQAGRFKGYMNYLHKHDDVFPMTYPIGEAYVKHKFNRIVDRDYDVVCTLRDDFHDAARMRVRQWVNMYAKQQGLTKYQGEQINKASRTTVDKNYFGQMYRAKIIVTVNPAGWEGDFRFMEALASGALIFVDHMYAPRPHPLLDGKHVIYYDNDNKTDLFVKLDYYRRSPKKARVVAINGYLHAMKHHRAACLLDYVLRSVEIKLAMRAATAAAGVAAGALGPGREGDRDSAEGDSGTKLPVYSDTGFDMHAIARNFDKSYKEASKGGKRNKRLVQQDFQLPLRDDHQKTGR